MDLGCDFKCPPEMRSTEEIDWNLGCSCWNSRCTRHVLQGTGIQRQGSDGRQWAAAFSGLAGKAGLLHCCPPIPALTNPASTARRVVCQLDSPQDDEQNPDVQWECPVVAGVSAAQRGAGACSPP